MNKNTLLAIIAICFTINILAGGYIYLEKKEAGIPAKATQQTQILATLPSTNTEAVVDEPEYSASNVTEEDQEDVVIHKAAPVTKKTRKQEVINHLDKYLNLVPYSQQKSQEGFESIGFSLLNKSPFQFDQVVVNFKCYLDNGTLWNEKNYVVGPIPANGSIEQMVPDQLRGSRIEWNTISINSTELEFVWQK